jgi:hypothetical protein
MKMFSNDVVLKELGYQKKGNSMNPRVINVTRTFW